MLQGLFLCLKADGGLLLSPQHIFTWHEEVVRMPKRLNVPCQHPGCPALVPAGQKYCEEHKQLHKDSRPNAAARGYDARWQKARKRFLSQHPLCVRCLAEGKYVQATVVDHIVPHRGNMNIFWDESNWQALCKHHHDQKTMTDDRYMEYRYPWE